MKKIFILLVIASTMIFVGCGNNITTSSVINDTTVDDIKIPDGLASTYDGTWYFYSEDGSIKGQTVSIANGGMTGIKTSSGAALDFVKNNFNSKIVLFDIYLLKEKNYVVYKEGYTGNINFNGNIAYIKIKDTSNNIVIEGMISRSQRNTTIDTAFTGTYTVTYGGGTVLKVETTTDLITFTRTTTSGKVETYKIPAVYFTKNGNSYTSDAINYPNSILNFDTLQFTLININTSYYASDAEFNNSGASSSKTTLSPNTLTYTKG